MSAPFATAWLNGRYVPLADARISPLDRGFLFGDGVYEVIPVYESGPFRLDAHLARLTYSLNQIELPNPYSGPRWREILTDLVNHNGGGRQSIYLEVTRGADAGREHRFPARPKATVFAFSQAFPPVPEASLTDGIRAVTEPDIRWQRCDIKSVSLLGNVLLRQQAEQQGAAETILLRDGFATEGASSTLFIVTADGVVCTPPKDNRLLPGITRDLVLHLARDANLACEERTIPATELASSAEIWLASSLREVLAVTQLDDTPVGNGRPGAKWREMYALFDTYKRNLIAA